MSWRDNEPCAACGAKNCYAHCSESADGKHVYSPGTIEVREERETDVLVDVNCAKCGQSGSCFITLNPDDINW